MEVGVAGLSFISGSVPVALFSSRPLSSSVSPLFPIGLFIVHGLFFLDCQEQNAVRGAPADFRGLPDHELSHCGFWNFLQFRFNGFCISLRPRRFGGNGSLALERVARAQGRLEASHIVNSGRCKRARSCESASSGASQNSFSIMGQGDPCTLF